ncbi:hypothetical protein LguiB_033567 [Lonicera macranthoides]
MAGKGAGASTMEAAANIAASAKAGLEKTRALVGEKVEKFRTSDPVEKDMATLKKEEKILRAELSKKEAYAQNAAASTGMTASYTAEGRGDLIGQDVTVVPHHPMAHDGLVTEDVVGGSNFGHDDLVTVDLVGSHYAVGTAVGVVDPPVPHSLESNTGTGGTPVGQGVVEPRYNIGENTGSGRTQIRDPKISGHTTSGGVSY